MPAIGDKYNPWRLFIGFLIPNEISRSTELSPTAKLVFGKLCQFAGENGQAYPSYKTLGEEIGVKQRQAMRAVQELVNHGLIRPVKRIRQDGGSATNVYEFLWNDIFTKGFCSQPGVKYDTGGSVGNVTPSPGHKRHPRVSYMAPKEKHTRESKGEEITTDEIKLLLSGTPLSKISDKESRILVDRHGSKQVILVADIAAETWRRERKEIKNPGGYLHTLCEVLVVPEWYEPRHIRVSKAEAATAHKLAEARKLSEKQEDEERKRQERDDYWRSLSEDERKTFRDELRQSSSLYKDLSGRFIEGSAKLLAWDSRAQMITNTSLTDEYHY